MDMANFAVISTLFLVVVVVMMEHSAPTAFATFRESGVNISNHIVDQGNDALWVDCMKGTKHRHIFSKQILPPGEHYYGWKFVPDIWGETKYDCDFTWGTHFRRVRVWEDTNWLRSMTTPRLCDFCVWHVTKEGLWQMTGARSPVFHGTWCQLGELTCVGSFIPGGK